MSAAASGLTSLLEQDLKLLGVLTGFFDRAIMHDSSQIDYDRAIG